VAVSSIFFRTASNSRSSLSPIRGPPFVDDVLVG
jgi:hypothetical protein